MSNLAIRVENISKKYNLGTLGYRSFKRDLGALFSLGGKRDGARPKGTERQSSNDSPESVFWALSDISFEVGQGDRLGIIGRNGAGKSTLLKVLSRITAPTEGAFKVRGRISSLLEVGTGFHPELTGRDNIFLNGAILGMKRREIQTKFDEIVAFSGVEKFIDTPVKRYSSGMYIRLAFSVAAHLESEIMIVDEVLAVGDAEFQKKCLGKMEDISKGQGRTILFVSHYIPAVRALCNRGLYLKSGKIAIDGTIDEAIGEYHFSNRPKSAIWTPSLEAEPIKYMRILEMDLRGRDGQPVLNSINSEEEVIYRLKFDLFELPHQFTIGFTIFNSRYEVVYRSLTTDSSDSFNSRFVMGTNEVYCIVPISFLASGVYFISLDASVHNQFWVVNPSENRDYDLRLEVRNDHFSILHTPQGPIAPRVVWWSNR